jgi:hypothetical protein
MTQRTFLQLKFAVGKRSVTVQAMDAIGPEDTLNVAIAASLHRRVTREDLWTPVPREVKDFMIRTNLTV